MAVTETCLDSSVLDHELQLYGYNIYRKDRSVRRGGGVLLAVKSHLTHFRRSDLETDMEMLPCLIYTRPAFCFLFFFVFRILSSTWTKFGLLGKVWGLPEQLFIYKYF